MHFPAVLNFFVAYFTLSAKEYHSMQILKGLICVRNAELCDAGILILFLSVMCSFSCWLVIQSLAVCHLQHILSSAEYVNQTHVPDILFYNMVDH